jgi:hypothetical protein
VRRAFVIKPAELPRRLSLPTDSHVLAARRRSWSASRAGLLSGTALLFGLCEQMRDQA